MSSVGSSIYTGTNSKKSYLTTANFNTEFYSYTVSKSSTTFNTLGAVALVDAAGTNSPAGRVLHENGKKLLPEVNPMTSFAGACLLQAPKFLVGVYDPVSLLSGFIDPTSNTFSVYDTNYNVGNFDGAVNGIIYNTDGQGSKLNVGVVNKTTATAGVINAGNASVGRAAFTAGQTNVVVNTTAFGPNSLVFITNVGTGYANVTYTSTGTNQFTIWSAGSPATAVAGGGGGTVTIAATPSLAVNWMVVN